MPRGKKRDIWAIIGAGIVLVTFLWNELERDHMKEAVDKLASARIKFAVHMGAYKTQRDLLEDKWVLLQFKTLQASSPVEEVKIDAAKSCVAIAKDELSTFRSINDAINELFQSRGESTKRTTSKEDVFEEEQTKVGRADVGLIKLDAQIKTRQKEGTEFSPAELDSIVDPLLKEACAAGHLEQTAETTQLGLTLALQSAERAQTLYEDKFNRDRHISYGLYGLGWLVAFIGKLAGKNEDAGQDPSDGAN